MRRFLVARREADFERVRNLYSLSEYFRSIGTGENEWIDADTFQAIIQEDWDSYDVVVDEVRRLEAFENGETGWVALEADRKAATGHTWTYRLTVVFVLEQGIWRAIQTHFSSPVDDMVLHGPELTRTLSELVESIDAPVAGTSTRTGTVAFTDIVGSTGLSEALGDAAWSETVGRHFAELRSIVAANGGTVVKTLGDGGMFVFDAASSALQSVADIRAATVDGRLPTAGRRPYRRPGGGRRRRARRNRGEGGAGHGRGQGRSGTGVGHHIGHGEPDRVRLRSADLPRAGWPRRHPRGARTALIVQDRER